MFFPLQTYKPVVFRVRANDSADVGLIGFEPPRHGHGLVFGHAEMPVMHL